MGHNTNTKMGYHTKINTDKLKKHLESIEHQQKIGLLSGLNFASMTRENLMAFLTNYGLHHSRMPVRRPRPTGGLRAKYPRA